ncbi:MAG: hypothetical protein NUW37_14450 [Planctomycetes bacterium]|nr:hypothetical protein [Planctomycetota bacterium]
MYQADEIWTDWIPKSQKDSAPEKSGVFDIADGGKEVLFIGSTDNLKKRLPPIFEVGLPTAEYFRYFITNTHGIKAHKRIKAFVKENGRMPKEMDQPGEKKSDSGEE